MMHVVNVAVLTELLLLAALHVVTALATFHPDALKTFVVFVVARMTPCSPATALVGTVREIQQETRRMIYVEFVTAKMTCVTVQFPLFSHMMPKTRGLN